MVEGQDNGDSGEPLTEDSATERLAGLLSFDEEDTQDADESQPEGVEPEETVDDEEEAEPVEETDEPAEEEEEPAEPSQPRKIKVKADGQDLEVTEDELVKGYSRQADYTRKTQEHAANVRKFNTESGAKAQEYASRFAQVDDLLQALSKEPDWNQVRAQGSEVYEATHQQWTAHKAKLDAIHAARVEAQEAADKAASEQLQQTTADEYDKLVAALPDLGDKAKGPQLKKDLVEYAGKMGFSAKELDGIVDHRALLMLHKAMMFDRGQQKAAATAPTAKQKLQSVKVAAPGSTALRPKVSDVTRAKQRLAKTHRQEDAVNALTLLLGD